MSQFFLTRLGQHGEILGYGSASGDWREEPDFLQDFDAWFEWCLVKHESKRMSSQMDADAADQIQNLAVLVARLASALGSACSAKDTRLNLAHQAMAYLRRQSLAGSILRSSSVPLTEQEHIDFRLSRSLTIIRDYVAENLPDGYCLRIEIQNAESVTDTEVSIEGQWCGRVDFQDDKQETSLIRWAVEAARKDSDNAF